MTVAGRVLPRVALAGLLVAFVWTGLQGINFGDHWDEQSLANRVKWSVVNGGTLLPGSYDWPSVSYWLALAAVVPEMTWPRTGDAAETSALEAHLVERLDSPGYRLRLRRMFLFITALVLIWIYLAAAAWSGSQWAGVAAAGLVGGSWQLAYHARWAAPDGLVVQFVALILLGAVLTRTRSKSALGPVVAATAAGLAVGSKYTAWPFALTWLASDVAWRVWHAQPWVRPALRGAALVAGAFVLSTPGVVLQPLRFVASLAYLKRHYSGEATVLAPYLVGDGWPMLSASAKYLGAVMSSPWMPIAFVISALAIAGVVSIARRDATLAILVAGGPILLIVSMALQPVLLVRNLLPVVAVVGFAAAAALADVGARFPRWRPLVAAGAAVVVCAHLGFLAYAATTVAAPNLAVRSYLSDYGNATCVSPEVAKSIAAVADPAHVRLCSDSPRAVMPWEGSFPPAVIGRPVVLGPLDVDALYYPTWLGSQHILITP